jgi:hypothetical protein
MGHMSGVDGCGGGSVEEQTACLAGICWVRQPSHPKPQMARHDTPQYDSPMSGIVMGMTELLFSGIGRTLAVFKMPGQSPPWSVHVPNTWKLLYDT